MPKLNHSAASFVWCLLHRRLAWIDPAVAAVVLRCFMSLVITKLSPVISHRRKMRGTAARDGRDGGHSRRASNQGGGPWDSMTATSTRSANGAGRWPTCCH
jgi:hypothetical protein